MQICGSCLNRHHEFCANEITEEFVCDCTHDTSVELGPPVGVGTIGNALNLDLLAAEELKEPDSPVRRQKNDDAVRDQQSTGRKRAAALYPLKNPDGSRVPCDIANKKAPTLPAYMEVQIDGCGVRPGTLPTHAQSRHHNDYNTLNNERHNILLLCHSCHNLLHAKNDPHKGVIYERIYGFKPSDEDLSHTAKALRSGVISKGLQEKHPDEENTAPPVS